MLLFLIIQTCEKFSFRATIYYASSSLAQAASDSYPHAVQVLL